MKKMIALIVVGMMCVGLFSGCTTTTPNSNTGTPTAEPAISFPQTITDQAGNTLTIKSMPAKVVSLSPTATEIIFALGLESKIVGRTDYCDFPAEASAVPSMGEMVNPNPETVVSTGAEFIIATSSLDGEIMKNLKNQGIPIYILDDMKGFEGAYDSIQTIGNLFGLQTKAEEVLAGIKAQLADVENRLKSTTTKPTMYYVAGFGEYGDYTAGAGSFIDEAIKLAGGSNVGEDAVNWKYSFEQIVKKNPEIIVAANMDVASFAKADKYKDLNAVKDGKLFGIDNNLLNRAGPRLGDGVVELSKILHPEAWK